MPPTEEPSSAPIPAGLSTTTKPIHFLGLIISPHSLITSKIRIPTTVSSTLIENAPLEKLMANADLQTYLGRIFGHFETTHQPALLQQAKDAGLTTCINCHGEGLGVKAALVPVLQANRFLVRVAVVCSKGDVKPPEEQIQCRLKAYKFLEDALFADIQDGTEGVSISVRMTQDNCIPGVMPKEEEGSMPYFILKAGPVAMIYQADVRDFAIRAHYESDIRKTLQGSAFAPDGPYFQGLRRQHPPGSWELKCGACGEKPTVAFTFAIEAVMERGLVLARGMEICEREGTGSACEAKAQEWMRGKLAGDVEWANTTEPLYTGGWGRNPKTEKCDRCGLKQEKLKMCSGCKVVCYCSRECQRLHWKEHHKTRCESIGNTRIQSPVLDAHWAY
ncbi:hypothetical protein BJ508DRAFT_43886 [Ascobolus immersus RN42]|uniref:MYND-type domain-containing protein n=1 Tax=Ascobolus immersus RN42 TaxID=1160509 RepID=A0A3N4HJA0_ASCIM|nr:hypothetical protein BJ508DRAFT_43886 [Ascobolus immersus RN42]